MGDMVISHRLGKGVIHHIVYKIQINKKSDTSDNVSPYLSVSSLAWFNCCSIVDASFPALSFRRCAVSMSKFKRSNSTRRSCNYIIINTIGIGIVKIISIIIMVTSIILPTKK